MPRPSRMGPVRLRVVLKLVEPELSWMKPTLASPSSSSLGS